MTASPALSTTVVESTGWRRDRNLTTVGLAVLISGQVFYAAAAPRYGYAILLLASLLDTAALLSILGGVLIVLGRRSFGPQHSRYGIWGLALYLAVPVLAVLSGIIEGYLFPAPFTLVYPSFLFEFVVGSALLTLVWSATLLFSYRLQRVEGKILLWSAWGFGLATVWTHYYPVAAYPEIMQTTYTILRALVSILFISAFTLAALRVRKNAVDTRLGRSAGS